MAARAKKKRKSPSPSRPPRVSAPPAEEIARDQWREGFEQLRVHVGEQFEQLRAQVHEECQQLCGEIDELRAEAGK